MQRLSRRVHELSGRRAIAGFTARLAMTERRADELTRATIDAMRSLFSVRDRQIRALDRRLDTSNASRRRLAIGRVWSQRTALCGRRSRFTAIAQDEARTVGEPAGHAQPARLSSARGYAVCWNEDQTRAIRDAADVAPGDTVHVTLSRGEIAAKVSRTE